MYIVFNEPKYRRVPLSQTADTMYMYLKLSVIPNLRVHSRCGLVSVYLSDFEFFMDVLNFQYIEPLV